MNLAGLFLDRHGRHRIALRDLENHIHSALDVAEQVVALGELFRVVDGANEELTTIRVRSGVGHRHRASRVLAEYRFVVELVAGPARSGTQWVSALDDEIRDDPVKLEPVVEMVARQEDKVVNSLWGQLWIEAHRDGALVGLHRHEVVVGRVDRHRRRRAVLSWSHSWARGWSRGGAWAAAGIASHIATEGNHSERKDGKGCQKLRNPPTSLAHPISSQQGMSAAACFAW